MTSRVLLERLENVRKALMAGHAGGLDVSSHSMGRDRELFINLVLSNIISVPFRVGTGEIVDARDVVSKQCDIVIEYMNTLSFPNIYPSAARLYLAESVCAVIEVKSTIDQQWEHVRAAAEHLVTLERDEGTAAVFQNPPPKVPFFAVGYRGWRGISSIKDNLSKVNASQLTVSGVLQLEPCMYVGAGPFVSHNSPRMYLIIVRACRRSAAMTITVPRSPGWRCCR
jgi:hypothetical protein